MIKKSDIRNALKAHHDAVTQLKQGLLQNSGDSVATALDAANCAWERVETLLAEKYPEHIELFDDEEEEAAEGVEAAPAVAACRRSAPSAAADRAISALTAAARRHLPAAAARDGEEEDEDD